MTFSRHTLIMALLLVTLLTIIGGYATYRSNWNSIKLSFIIIFLSIIRFLTPVESKYAIPIEDSIIYPHLDLLIRKEIFNNITILHILCFIWCIGFLVCISRLTFRLYKQWRLLQHYAIPPSHHLYETCNKAATHIGMTFTGTIGISSNCSTAMMIGVFRPNIILPISFESLPEEQIHYIFCHELSHFKGKDSWMKLIINVLCCILWWNPAVYLLRNGLDHMLELRCDKNVCSTLTLKEQFFYANMLLQTAPAQEFSPNILASEYNVKKNDKIFEHRINQIVPNNTNKKEIPLFNIFLVIVSIGLFILSYQVVLQPYFPSPSLENDVEVEMDDDDDNNIDSSFILKKKNGELLYFKNGEYYTDLTEDMLKKEPYCNLPIYDGY